MTIKMKIIMTSPIMSHIQHFQAFLELSCNLADSFDSEDMF